MFGSSRVVRRIPPLALALLLAACASTTPIGDLLANSSKYNGTTVSVKGEVSKSIGAIVAGAYQIKDNTGTLTVVSEGNSPPPEGSKLTVKGIFQSLVTLGSKSLAVLREESRETH
ncbi:MAG TPA: hypothetical protein VFI77_01590 [Gemmatimonadales bacterium]|nr:hypothetical protein [Gemmatimonadales bacterium]